MSTIRARLRNRQDTGRHQKRIRQAVRELAPTEFISHPEPTTPGDYARGLRLLNGEFFHESQIHNLEGSIWDYNYPSENLYERFLAFDWMDDLAALKTGEANRLMQQWCYDWIQRYGQGEGEGWRADLLGWRLIRMITHATTLLYETTAIQSERFFESLGVQTNYLRQVAASADDGLPRVVCYVAWLFAALSLNRFHDDIGDVLKKIDAEASELVDNDDIYLFSRNPEELSQIFCLLVWVDQALEDTDLVVGKYHNNAIDVLGRAIRGLRFGERKLLPINGGGTGNPEEIDRALSEAQIQGATHDDNIIGFRQVQTAALTAFFDTTNPPTGVEYDKAHASTLGLWVAEKGKILIGSGGAALQQPLVTRVERQESEAHSTLVMSNRSSSVLQLKKVGKAQHTTGAFIARPAKVFDFGFNEDHQSITIQATHDGYREDFGFVHQRKLVFDRDGYYFGGLDVLTTQNKHDERKVKSVMNKKKRTGIPVDIFFHLGPTIEPSLDNNGEMVSFRSPLGHLWIFRQVGGRIDLVEENYYHSDRVTPSASKAIVIRTRLMDLSGYVTWSFQAYPDR